MVFTSEVIQKPMRIALIPARGGSKRIPRKNIKMFHGKPIISYTIEAALNSSLFDDVMVSTDDEEIAELAKKYGASIPFFRSAETSNDRATTLEVILEVLNKYEKNGINVNEFCCIYPCAPFISGELIKVWDSLQDIRRELGFTPSNICRCCKGEVKRIGGFLWEYAD